jgi:hypothetical protein
MEVNSLRSWAIASFACCGIVQHEVLYSHERSEFTSCLLPAYFLLFFYFNIFFPFTMLMPFCILLMR